MTVYRVHTRCFSVGGASVIPDGAPLCPAGRAACPSGMGGTSPTLCIGSVQDRILGSLQVRARARYSTRCTAQRAQAPPCWAAHGPVVPCISLQFPAIPYSSSELLAVPCNSVERRITPNVMATPRDAWQLQSITSLLTPPPCIPYCFIHPLQFFASPDSLGVWAHYAREPMRCFTRFGRRNRWCGGPSDIKMRSGSGVVARSTLFRERLRAILGVASDLVGRHGFL